MLKSYQNLCEKCAPWGMTILRIVLGLILIMHGYPKLFGNTAGLLAFFQSTVLPFPSFMLTFAGVLEFFGGILLIVGLFTRFLTTLFLVEFIVIILFVRLPGSFSKMELDLLVFGSLFALNSLGGGSASLDSFVQMYRSRRQAGGSKEGGHGSEAIGG